MITPYLALVLAAFAAFIVTLLVTWLRNPRSDKR